MFIPQEKIIVAMDVSGSILPNMRIGFQILIENMLGREFNTEIELYLVQGKELKKISLHDFLSKDINELSSLGDGYAKISNLASIKQDGVKIFLTDGLFGDLKYLPLENWLIICEESEVKLLEEDLETMGLFEMSGILNLSKMSNILFRIGKKIKEKRKMVFNRECCVISVL